jgi:chaperonin cofactor prefoldin
MSLREENFFNYYNATRDKPKEDLIIRIERIEKRLDKLEKNTKSIG